MVIESEQVQSIHVELLKELEFFEDQKKYLSSKVTTSMHLFLRD